MSNPDPTHHVHNSNDPLPTRSAQDAPQSTTEYVKDNPELTPGNKEQRPEGGVARAGNEGLPQSKPSLTDKLVGKTKKVAGKLKKNPDTHEKGELREAEGRGD